MGTNLKQNIQIDNSEIYNDNFSSPTYSSSIETSATTLEDDLNALRTQIKRILGTSNWYSTPPNTLQSFALANAFLGLSDTPSSFSGKNNYIVKVNSAGSALEFSTLASLSLNTSIVSEGTNLYYTDERVDDRVNVLIQDNTGISWTYDDNAGTLTPTITFSELASLSSFTTTDLSEGTNLYYTDERVDDRVSSLIQNGTGISWSYNDVSNIFIATISLSSFSTTNLSEGTRLYYTDERVDDRVSSLIQNGTGISWTYDDTANTLTPAISLSSFSTTNLSEGVNLYYTNLRVSSLIKNGTGITWSYDGPGGSLTPTISLSSFTTTNLSEGTNKYYTDARVSTYLSTWVGTTSITTLGTISTGVWHGTAITDTYISSASTWNNHLLNTNNPHAVDKTDVGLSNVENTALSTWVGSSNITTVGTLTGLFVSYTSIGASVVVAELMNHADTNYTGSTLRLHAGSSSTYGVCDITSIRRANGADLVLYTSSSATPPVMQEIIRLTTGGKVGIGTGSPLYKLDVAGDGNFDSNLSIGGSIDIAGRIIQTVNVQQITSTSQEILCPTSFIEIWSSGPITISSGQIIDIDAALDGQEMFLSNTGSSTITLKSYAAGYLGSKIKTKVGVTEVVLTAGSYASAAAYFIFDGSFWIHIN